MSQSFGEEHKENEEHMVLNCSCSSKKKKKKINLTNFFSFFKKIIRLEIFILFLSDVAFLKM